MPGRGAKVYAAAEAAAVVAMVRQQTGEFMKTRWGAAWMIRISYTIRYYALHYASVASPNPNPNPSHNPTIQVNMAIVHHLVVFVSSTAKALTVTVTPDPNRNPDPNCIPNPNPQVPAMPSYAPTMNAQFAQCWRLRTASVRL